MALLSRRDMLKGVLGGALYPFAAAHAVQAGARPNLLYIFPDEWRQQALGFMQSDPVRTPTLDRFAAESVIFTQAVSNIPICSPHRAMLLTGQYPTSNGVPENCNSGNPEIFLRPDARTFSDVLSEGGYACGYIGKYHLDTPTEEDAKYGEGPRGKKGVKGGGGLVWDAYTPPDRRHGFSFWHAYGCCDRHFTPHYWVGDAPVSQPLQVKAWSPHHETEVAEAFIRNPGGTMRDPGKPFALFVAHNPPHMPFDQVPDEYRALYAEASPESLLVRKNVDTRNNGMRVANGASAPRSVNDYFAMISGIDGQVARLLRALKESGQEENTIVVFSSDHGEMMGSHNRMGKGVYYDESFLIPFILRYPGKLKPRRESLHFNTPDIMPTLLGLMGLGDQIPASVEGADRSGLLLTGTGERPGSTFFISGLRDANSGCRAVRTDRYTFAVVRGRDAGVRLYDRQADPWQLTDCAAEQPEVCRELTVELNRWLKQTHDPWKTIEWPITFPNCVGVRLQGDTIRLELDASAAGLQQRQSLTAASRLEKDAEGHLWVRTSTMGDSERFHEYLTLSGVLNPDTTYTLSYTCTLKGVGAEGELYHVVRSPSTQNRALRRYWRPELNQPEQVEATFKTGSEGDYQLLLGIHYQADVAIRDVVIVAGERN